MKTILAFLATAALAAHLISQLPTQQEMRAEVDAAQRYRVLQSIPSHEMLAIALECMIEDGADESDILDAVTATLRK